MRRRIRHGANAPIVITSTRGRTVGFAAWMSDQATIRTTHSDRIFIGGPWHDFAADADFLQGMGALAPAEKRNRKKHGPRAGVYPTAAQAILRIGLHMRLPPDSVRVAEVLEGLTRAVLAHNLPIKRRLR